jgi:hypothetical protein
MTIAGDAAIVGTVLATGAPDSHKADAVSATAARKIKKVRDGEGQYIPSLNI